LGYYITPFKVKETGMNYGNEQYSS
jgi:hypothetical protein